jgi:peptidoglycan hydrolase CwlO-like protein
VTTTENAIAALKSDLEGLNTEIAEQKKRHKAERDVLRVQRAPLARAIRALSGGSKPMSEEAKAAIRAGLEKARAAKQAATATASANSTPAPVVSTPTMTKPTASNVGSPAVVKKDTVSDRGAVRTN